MKSYAKFFMCYVKINTVNGCGEKNNLIIREMGFPLDYTDIVFDFTNIGTVLGAIVGTIGNIALSFSQGMIVDLLKKTVEDEVPTLLCDSALQNRTRMEKIPAEVNQQE